MTQDAIAQMTFLTDMPGRERPAPASPVYDKAPRRVLPIRELPESERPVNRLHFYGPPALSTTELLAIFIAVPATPERC